MTCSGTTPDPVRVPTDVDPCSCVDAPATADAGECCVFDVAGGRCFCEVCDVGARPSASQDDAAPVEGIAASEDVCYGVPDVLGRDRDRYAGRRVLVAGGGASAVRVLLDLLTLARESPSTRILWVVHRPTLDRALDGIGLRLRAALDARRLRVVRCTISRVTRSATGLVAASATHTLPEVDAAIVVTGVQPAFGLFVRERFHR